MERPHIVFVHVDQMHHRAVSAYGCPDVHTPHIDRIVGDGQSFMLNHTAMPQCSPARTSWMTGRMSKEHGVVVNGCPIDPKIPDLGQWLRRHGGYETVYTGKWHVPGRNPAKSFRFLHSGQGHGEMADSDVARSAIAYLANRQSDKPFFLSVGLWNPHDCCYATFKGGGPYKYAIADGMKDRLPPLPENFDYDYPETGQSRVRGWSLTDWRFYRYTYYRQVEMVDREVGRIYDALRSSPYADDTLFIFTSDHGDGLGYHANVSKGYLEDEAWRVPAVVSWPGEIEGDRRDDTHLTSGVDIPATICDYAEIPRMPKTTIGRSLRPLLEGRSVDWRSYVIGETSIPQLSTAVREADYKSIFYADGEPKLFNMTKDPLETENVARDPDHRDVLERHREHFREYIDRIELYTGPGRGPKKHQAQKRYDRYTTWYRAVRQTGGTKQ